MLKFWRDRFHIANSSDYGWKEEIFYPLKYKLLKEHATYRGWMKQTIQHPCWTCEGSGVIGVYQCQSCGGDGIYNTKEYYLAVYDLDGQIYHMPTALCFLSPEKCLGVISGKITHTNYGSKAGYRALKWLMFRYQTRFFFHHIFNEWTASITRGWLPVWMSCTGWQQPIIILAGLFLGYFPVEVYAEGVRLARRHRRLFEAEEHLLWVFAAWNLEDLDDMPF